MSDQVTASPATIETDGSLPFPTPLGRLIGRAAEVATVASLVQSDGSRLITITGPGGVGKTRLAIAVADVLAPHFSGGIAFADLSQVTDPDLFLPTIADALGVRHTGDYSIRHHLSVRFRSATALLVVDNMEQILDAAPHLTALLSACAGLTIIVTSRERLRVSGERVFELAPFAVAAATGHSHTNGCTSQSSSDAIRLFEERARFASSSYHPSEEDRPTVGEICARLDGLPLAIELAAARIGLLPPRALLERLDLRLPLLTGGARDQPDRQRTLRNAVRWSYDLLTPDEQRVFRGLAVFHGGIPLESAIDVATGILAANNEGERSPALDVLERLVAQNLLTRTPHRGGQVRFTMLETIREFAFEQLLEADAVEMASRLHAAWFKQFASARRPLPSQPNDHAALEELARSYANVRAALAWMVRTGDHRGAAELVTDLAWYWSHRGDLHEGATWIDWALETQQQRPDRDHSELYIVRALIHLAIGQSQQAHEHSIVGLSQARATNDTPGIIRALIVCGATASNLGEFDLAQSTCEEAIALTDLLEDTTAAAGLLANATGNLGVAVHSLGDLDRALALHRQALDLHRGLHSRRGEMVALSDISEVARDQGRLDLAVRSAQDALRIGGDLAANRITGEALDVIGEVAINTGDVREGVRFLGTAEKLRSTAGIQMWLTYNRDAYDAASAAARTALGAETFELERQNGAARTVEAAITDALARTVPSGGPTRASPQNTGQGGPALTPREADVLHRLVAGDSDADIAAKLFLSVRTVEHHVANILGKLGVRSRTAAVSVAMSSGMAHFAESDAVQRSASTSEGTGT